MFIFFTFCLYFLSLTSIKLHEQCRDINFISFCVADLSFCMWRLLFFVSSDILAATLLFFFSVFQANQEHSLDICCGSTVRKFGLGDEIVKSLKFSNMKVELKIGMVNQTGKSSCQQAYQ